MVISRDTFVTERSAKPFRTFFCQKDASRNDILKPFFPGIDITTTTPLRPKFGSPFASHNLYQNKNSTGHKFPNTMTPGMKTSAVHMVQMSTNHYHIATWQQNQIQFPKCVFGNTYDNGNIQNNYHVKMSCLPNVSIFSYCSILLLLCVYIHNPQ
jgi:hypothetical protein